ncbi:uncharacterized protein BDR25DRAFT_344539 [Lindgomyces ingoldianus]|uniref:Uncharacterized protein n=1 Tax=Lindgomyces ingoldianus TaxID=673940 RepID=A0ACB6QMZ0_9PLEO|nr:uncharacterized protein BDR25DRAFT_344539 [Lindgomyces ingoldianus]KAF2468266.1 hypothetical protein BDR25DRAFT_344539 [Lindgomyces ingoldianus]
MKYSAIIVALAAGAFAIPQASTITSAPPTAASAALTPQVSCALACPASDVTCQAACLGNARPNESQVIETNNCAAKCDQGDGTPAATEKYSQCVQACIASYFPSSQTLAAPAAGSNAPSAASNAASATGAAASGSAGASNVASGTGAKPTGSSTASGAAASSSSTGAASSNNVQLAGAGLAGLFMAVFAL